MAPGVAPLVGGGKLSLGEDVNTKLKSWPYATTSSQEWNV
jgi:hypothetical protein